MDQRVCFMRLMVRQHRSPPGPNQLLSNLSIYVLLPVNGKQDIDLFEEIHPLTTESLPVPPPLPLPPPLSCFSFLGFEWRL